MTTATSTAPRHGTALAAAAGGGLRGAVASEWTKLWSVRSTGWCLIATALAMTGYSVLMGISQQAQFDGGRFSEPYITAPEVAVDGVVMMGQLPVIALAALVIASEYATGSIRATLQWVPVRARMLAAKTGVLMAALFGAGVLFGALATAVAVPALGQAGAATSVGAVLARCASIGVYLALLGAMTIGVGTAVRSVAGSLTIMLGLLAGVPIVLQAIGAPELVGHFFPAFAGMDVMMGLTTPHSPLIALAVLVAWTTAAQLAGYAVLRHRDA